MKSLKILQKYTGQRSKFTSHFLTDKCTQIKSIKTFLYEGLLKISDLGLQSIYNVVYGRNSLVNFWMFNMAGTLCNKCFSRNKLRLFTIHHTKKKKNSANPGVAVQQIKLRSQCSHHRLVAMTILRKRSRHLTLAIFNVPDRHPRFVIPEISSTHLVSLLQGGPYVIQITAVVEDCSCYGLLA